MPLTDAELKELMKARRIIEKVRKQLQSRRAVSNAAKPFAEFNQGYTVAELDMLGHCLDRLFV